MIDRDTNNHENLQLCFKENPLRGKVLFVDDFPMVIDTLTDDLADLFYWHTRYSNHHVASCVPPDGMTYDNVLIRLPKSHEYFDYVLQIVSHHIIPGGKVYVYGLNDEGIKGAAKKLKVFYGNVETELIKNHGRILSSYITVVSQKKTLVEFATSHELTYKGKKHEMIYYPGMFAHGELDDGTSLLLDHCIPVVRDNMHILDYACGSGIIGKILCDQAAGITLDALDNDTLSLAATQLNVPQLSRLILAETLNSHPKKKTLDLIVSNPPIHTEKNLQYETLFKLIQHGFQHLVPGGRLIIVIQARITAEDQLESVFGNYAVLAETTRFKVLEAIA